jgi:hypothetical protein
LLSGLSWGISRNIMPYFFAGREEFGLRWSLSSMICHLLTATFSAERWPKQHDETGVCAVAAKASVNDA